MDKIGVRIGLNMVFAPPHATLGDDIGGWGNKKMPPSGGEPSRRRKLYLC